MSKAEKYYEKIGKANRVMEDLIDIAISDKNISDDEKKLLYRLIDAMEDIDLEDKFAKNN